MLDTADVLADREPPVDVALGEGLHVVVRVDVAKVVPRGINERVHRVRLALGGGATRWARHGAPLFGGGQRRAPLGCVVLDLRQAHGQISIGHGHEPTRRTVDDRNRRTPVTLARDEPVAEAVGGLLFATPVLCEPRGYGVLGVSDRHAVELSRVDEHRVVAGAGEGLLLHVDLGVGSGDDLSDR